MKSFLEFIEHYIETVRLTPSFDTFTGAMLDFEKLLDQEITGHVQAQCFRLLYAGVFAALEAYLCDTFIQMVLERNEIRDATLRNQKLFDRKYTLAEVSSKDFDLQEEIVKKLSAVLWHNLDRVCEIYTCSIAMTFPEISNNLRGAVLTRHDIVHRNGSKVDGSEVLISDQDVHELISEVEMFVLQINSEIIEHKKSV